MISDDILLRPPSNENWGTFFFNPVALISGTDRCDNGQYGPAIMLGDGYGEYSKAPFSSLKEVDMYEVILFKIPHFCIAFSRLLQPMTSDSPNKIPKLWKDIDSNHPARYWKASSLSEFLRVMWEWHVVSLEPFSSTEKQATTANAFFENIDVPQFVLDEILNLPDMYIFKYLKNDTSARYHDSAFYPDISNEAKQWFKQLCLDNPYISNNLV